jgi:hypothetical protein
MTDKPSPRARTSRQPYDQAVRAALVSRDRDQVTEMLAGVRRLQAEYGDFDTLIARVEAALAKC